MKRNCVQLYLRQQRASEEIGLVKHEMSCVIDYWQEQFQILKQYLETCDKPAEKFLISEVMGRVSDTLNRNKALFNSFVHIENPLANDVLVM